VNDKVHSDPIGWHGERVRLMMQGIEELHKRYVEQEQVIKDCINFIAELLAEIDSKGSDSDSGPNYDRGAAEDSEEDLEEVPMGDTPQE
jgi:hypothetical protein